LRVAKTTEPIVFLLKAELRPILAVVLYSDYTLRRHAQEMRVISVSTNLGA
jgi:hypothetical protein